MDFRSQKKLPPPNTTREHPGKGDFFDVFWEETDKRFVLNGSASIFIHGHGGSFSCTGVGEGKHVFHYFGFQRKVLVPFWKSKDYINPDRCQEESKLEQIGK